MSINFNNINSNAIILVKNEAADSVTEVKNTLVYIKTVISLSNPHSKNRISVQLF